ncbi:MAG: chemotaxis protein CheW [Treponema sp.]|nr:chemotaxis protein CheW [Candidatus Treponema caballi]
MEAVAENILAAQLAEEADEERKEQMTVIDFKMVTFSLAGKDYAIDIMKVKEIAKAGRFTYVPNTSPFVLGVYNLRGDIIPIIDLRLFFNIDIPERKGNEIENMIIVGVGDQSYGVVIDQIDKVVGIQKSSIQPPHPLFGDISIKFISGVVESNNRLYILLDIDRIFGSRKEELDESHNAGEASAMEAMQQGAEGPKPVKKAPVKQAAPAAAPAAKPAEPEKPSKNDAEYGFLIESLRNMRKFNTSFLNEKWVKTRFDEWCSSRGAANIQLTSEKDADEFLKPFSSRNTGAFWSEQYARELFALLPENAAKQMYVWNPGCGNGAESYSLACLLRKRYPDARIRIYAHDVDLLSVSNAPLINVPAEAAASWLKPFVTKTVSGGYTFNQDIKDAVMFEYHDCLNTNAMPNVDLIFTRDLLSFLPEHSQKTLIADFEEKLKGNGVLIIGENESLSLYPQWHAKSAGLLTVYSK